MMTTERAGSRRRVRPQHVIAAWAIFIALLLLWQVIAYRGLMALAAEWEFDTFGRYYPALTYVALVVLFASPLLWLLRDPHAADRTAPGGAFIRVLSGIAIASAAGSLIAALVMAMQPDAAGAARRVTIGSAASLAPAEGATVLVGDVVGDRVAGLSENLFVARRSFRFVPMRAPGSRDGAIRYFAEIDDDNTIAAAQREGSLTGILKRAALPGELVHLFRYAGFEVAPDYQVLFARRDSLQWPHRVLAAELLLVALLCGVGALGLHLRRQRLLRQADRQSSAV
jgi:hypothetical protein